MSPKIKLSTVAFVLAACVATSISAFAEDAPARMRWHQKRAICDGSHTTCGSAAVNLLWFWSLNAPLTSFSLLHFKIYSHEYHIC
jgi:hypothetical protein